MQVQILIKLKKQSPAKNEAKPSQKQSQAPLSALKFN